MYQQYGSTQIIFVVHGLKATLFGLPAITALRHLHRVDATQAGGHSIKEHFPNIFCGLGNLGKEYTIKPKEGAVPYSLYTPRNIPISLRDNVREELNRMELARVITKVDEPTPWCVGMVVVPTLVVLGWWFFP